MLQQLFKKTIFLFRALACGLNSLAFLFLFTMPILSLGQNIIRARIPLDPDKRAPVAFLIERELRNPGPLAMTAPEWTEFVVQRVRKLPGFRKVARVSVPHPGRPFAAVIVTMSPHLGLKVTDTIKKVLPWNSRVSNLLEVYSGVDSDSQNIQKNFWNLPSEFLENTLLNSPLAYRIGFWKAFERQYSNLASFDPYSPKEKTVQRLKNLIPQVLDSVISDVGAAFAALEEIDDLAEMEDLKVSGYNLVTSVSIIRRSFRKYPENLTTEQLLAIFCGKGMCFNYLMTDDLKNRALRQALASDQIPLSQIYGALADDEAASRGSHAIQIAEKWEHLSPESLAKEFRMLLELDTIRAYGFNATSGLALRSGNYFAGLMDAIILWMVNHHHDNRAIDAVKNELTAGVLRRRKELKIFKEFFPNFYHEEADSKSRHLIEMLKQYPQFVCSVVLQPPRPGNAKTQ